MFSCRQEQVLKQIEKNIETMFENVTYILRWKEI